MEQELDLSDLKLLRKIDAFEKKFIRYFKCMITIQVCSLLALIMKLIDMYIIQ